MKPIFTGSVYMATALVGSAISATASRSRQRQQHAQHAHRHRSQSIAMNMDPLTISRGSLSLSARRVAEQLSAERACEVTTESEMATERMVTCASMTMHMRQPHSLICSEQHMEQATRQ